jgi:hypothetical protein
MTQEATSTQVLQQSPTPDSVLKALGDALVGTWEISGGAQGQVRYEWLEGGFFLIQHVELNSNKGIEIIGRERLFGATEPSKDIKSRYYGHDGSTFDYVYELEGDTLTIWGGEKVRQRITGRVQRRPQDAHRSVGMARRWVQSRPRPGSSRQQCMQRISIREENSHENSHFKRW